MTGNITPSDITNITLTGYQSFQDYWSQSAEATVFWALKTCVPPVLVVIGCVGNALAITALRQHCIKSSSVGYYLTLLAACYITLLLSTVGLEWISYMRSVALLTNSSDSLCRICQFVYNVLNHCPYWIIALMLTDRTVYVCLPLYSSSFCTVFMAKLLSVFMISALVIVNIHNMWTYGLGKYGCTIDPHDKDFYTTTWPWIAASVNCYLPLCYIHILLLFTSCLAWFRASTRHSSVVIVTALAFVILTDPSVTLNLIQYAKPAWISSYQGYARMYLLIELFQVSVWVNMAVTFVLYFLFIPKLRALCSRTVSDHDGMLMLQESSLLSV